MRACYESVSFDDFGSRPCVLKVYACTYHCATCARVHLDRLKGIMGDEESVVTVILPLFSVYVSSCVSL